MKRFFVPAVLLAWLASACASTPARITPPPPAPLFCVAPNIHASTVDGPPVAGAHVLINGASGTTNGNGYLYLYPLSAGPATIHVEADGFRPAEVPYTVSTLACDVAVALQPSVVRRFPPETQPLVVCANHYAFCHPDGSRAEWRGASLFRAYGRFKAGEDLGPDLIAIAELGPNLVRVFPQWEATEPAPNTGDHLDDAADFEPTLRAFIERLALAGVYVELTAIANWRTPDQDRPTLQHVYNAAAGHWNAVVEIVNEPWVRGYDVRALLQGVDRHGVLTALGYQPEPDGAGGWRITAKADYITVHLPRDQHYPRNSKDLLEMRGLGAPLVGDEPWGIGEQDKPGPGARLADLDAHVSHFAVCALYAAGCTIHSQIGLLGRMPTGATTPHTRAVYDAIGQAWLFFPPAVLDGAYARNGLGDFPLQVKGADTFDGQGHAYASLLGGIAYVVVPKPTGIWSPRLVNGWRLTATGPQPYLLAVTKP